MLSLLLLPFLQAANPAPAPAAINAYYSGRQAPCSYAPAIPLKPAVYTVTVTDGAFTAVTYAQVNPVPQGKQMMMVWYTPRGAACPVITAVAPYSSALVQ